jgi:hypothetical protein
MDADWHSQEIESEFHAGIPGSIIAGAGALEKPGSVIIDRCQKPNSAAMNHAISRAIRQDPALVFKQSLEIF